MITTKLATAAISALVLPAVLTMSAPSAQASEPSTDSTSVNTRVEQDVQALLRLNPGSRRIATNVVEVNEGVTISVPLQINSVEGCATYWLCLSENSNFGGEQLRFQACHNENLSEYRMSNGRTWNDRVSSIRNARGGGVQSRFYNYDGSGDPDDSSNWKFVIALNSGNYLRDLSKDTSADGGYANDKIDIVDVC